MKTALLFVLWALVCTQIFSELIQEIVEKDPETKTLWDLIQKSQLESYFNDTTLLPKHTFFAPNNAAITGRTTLDNETFLYHFLNYDGGFDLNEQVFNQTLFGEYLRVVKYNNKTYIGGLAEVLNTTEATDGFVHVISKTLSWVPQMNDTIATFLSSNMQTNYTTLLKLLNHHDLVGVFSDPNIYPENSYTVFAPEDSAFTNLTNVLAILNLEKYRSISRLIVTGHVLPGCYFSTAFTAGEIVNFTSIDNHTLSVRNDNGDFTVGTTDAKVVQPSDLQFRNGLVHTVSSLVFADGLSLPEFSMGDYVQAFFPKLYQQFVDNNLTNILEEGNNKTLLAPLDESFNTPIDSETLRYHFINESVDNFNNRIYYTALEGSWIRFNEYNGTHYANGLEKLGSDNSSVENIYLTSNGRIYTLSKPLTPLTPAEKQSIYEHFENSPDLFSNLTRALNTVNNNTDWIAALNGTELEQSYTVFAPVDSAFSSLPSDVFDFLFDSNQEELLKRVLSYHVASGTYFSTYFQPGNNTVTSLGGEIIVEVVNGSVSVIAWENAKVTNPNVFLRNGVVHVVNRVILPFSVIDIIQDHLPLPGAIILEGLTEFSTQLSNANLLSVISNTDAKYTLFAPINSAFNGSDLLSLKQLSYHILEKEVYFYQLTNDDAIEGIIYPMNDTFIRFNNYGTAGFWLNGESEIIKSNLSAVNGVVHVISKVLDLPTEMDKQNIFEYLQMNEKALNVSSLYAAINSSIDNFSSTLNSQNLNPSYTLFAPVESAFYNISKSPTNNYTYYAIFSGVDKALLVKALNSHVVLNSHFEVEIPNNTNVKLNNTNNESLLFAHDENDSITINGFKVSKSQRVKNGVVYLIDGIILPTLYEQSVLSKLESNSSQYGPLLEALSKAQMLTTILTNTNITLFAPDSDYLTWGEVENATAEILQRHLVSGVKTLVNDQYWTLLNDPTQFIRFNRYDDKTYINGLPINVYDQTTFQADGPVIYRLNGTTGNYISPVHQLSVEQAVKPSNTSHNFLKAVTETNNEKLISVIAPPSDFNDTYTFFVPTDNAFDVLASKYTGAVLDNLFSENHKESLKALLVNHILKSGYFPAALNGNNNYTNYNGDKFELVDGKYGNVSLAGLPYTQVSNGVVYRVDSILVPSGWTFPNNEPSSPTPDNTLAIVLGSVLGGLVLILIIVGIICFARKKRGGYEAVKS